MKNQALNYQYSPFILPQEQRFYRSRIILEKLLHWLPRLVGLTIPLVMTFYAFRIINEGGDLFQTATALFVQFMPILLYAVILAFAWEWDWLGALILTGLAIMDISGAWQMYPAGSTYDYSILLISSGLLFLCNSTYLYLKFRYKKH